MQHSYSFEQSFCSGASRLSNKRLRKRQWQELRDVGADLLASTHCQTYGGFFCSLRMTATERLQTLVDDLYRDVDKL
jgi:hypothetical protein